MAQNAIILNNISKVFYLQENTEAYFKHYLAKRLKGLLTGNARQEEKEFWALKDISFTLDKGQILSIIGDNGAGKSTLLKIISNVMQPTSGYIETNGSIRALLEVGTGFHPELSGRENIIFNGTLLGFKRKEIIEKFDEIVAFSGIDQFVDVPIKFYSNGMRIRLGFSIAINLRPEILILDEVLMVGDAEFKKRSLAKVKEISREQGCSAIFVSHNFGAVRNVCDKGILLSKGRIEKMGEINSLIEGYKEVSYEKAEKETLKSLGIKVESVQKSKDQKQNNALDEEDFGAFVIEKSWADEFIDNEVVNLHRVYISPTGQPLGTPIQMDEDVDVVIEFEKKNNQGQLDATLQFVSGIGDLFLVSSQAFSAIPIGASHAGKYKATCTIPKNFLNSGIFYIDLLFHLDKAKKAILRINKVLIFEVDPKSEEFGIPYRRVGGPVRPLLNWHLEQK
ncbi:MAG: ABC transporter ATP-binding protein [Bacteroidota bacterium]